MGHYTLDILAVDVSSSRETCVKGASPGASQGDGTSKATFDKGKPANPANFVRSIDCVERALGDQEGKYMKSERCRAGREFVFILI